MSNLVAEAARRSSSGITERTPYASGGEKGKKSTRDNTDQSFSGQPVRLSDSVIRNCASNGRDGISPLPWCKDELQRPEELIAEPRAVLWATNMEKVLRKHVAEQAGLEARLIECRQTMCAVEASGLTKYDPGSWSFLSGNAIQEEMPLYGYERDQLGSVIKVYFIIYRRTI
ncbi:MAG: hypothetical protein LC114_26770 [Bryobacterales bacterium]|nr:hypothetical protein [Bryobacterales bacterium]